MPALFQSSPWTSIFDHLFNSLHSLRGCIDFVRDCAHSSLSFRYVENHHVTSNILRLESSKCNICFSIKVGKIFFSDEIFSKKDFKLMTFKLWNNSAFYCSPSSAKSCCLPHCILIASAADKQIIPQISFSRSVVIRRDGTPWICNWNLLNVSIFKNIWNDNKQIILESTFDSVEKLEGTWYLKKAKPIV